MPEAIEDLARGVYTALAAGDADALGTLLAPDLDARVADGMPAGLGGRVAGSAAMIETWWGIGRLYRVRPEAEEYIPCADGRLLVTGFYRGTSRASGAAFEAAFTHLWTAAGGRIVALRQVTDTARWPT